MSDELQEEINKLPEFTFSNNLDNANDLECNDIDSYMNPCSVCSSNDKLKAEICKITKNYRLYEQFRVHDSQNKYCRYFKRWLFKEKYRFEQNQGLNSSDLTKCNWDIENYPNSIVNTRSYLDDFCSIKEYLETTYSLNTNRDKCLFYNKKRQYYLKTILRYIASISPTTTFNQNYFKIHEDCSFGNFEKTFPEIICPCNDTCSKDEKPKAESGATCPSSESALEPLVEASQEIAAEHTITNCSYNGIFVSSAITLLVTVFIFFVLCRFSPFGTWLYSRLKKKNILLKSADDQINENFSEFSLINTERNLEKKRPYIGYEPY
ncbi:PIR protein [Plasmodium ovale]|uniref:PIR protein n=1 Tax=Plasmodium ovale TaxID=36330 RepID=A0A1C3KJV1_PLAOA|nr:PIR protein [Plasmodium ovale]